MATEDSKRLRVVYAGALQRDPEERTDYLREVCAGQPELRAKVEALLQAHSQEFAESEAVTRSVSSDGIEGKVIGPYIVERELVARLGRSRFFSPTSFAFDDFPKEESALVFGLRPLHSTNGW